MSSNRILINVDILRRIFKHSDSSQNYHNALVSKIWSNQALSILWRTLDSLLPLLRLLGPMTLVSRQKGGPYYKYDRLIRSEDWDVFRRYAWRVRRIDNGYLWHPNFCDSVFMDIIIASRTLSTVELLPNLQSLSSEDTLFIQKWIPLFINKSLSALDLQVSGLVDGHLLTRTLSHLPHLCPKLRNLLLSTEFELDDAPQFDAALSSLLLLKELVLSSRLLSLLMINTLAHLPYLESFTIMSYNMDEESILPAMPLSDAFPSLRTFASDTIGFRSIVSFLEAYEPRELHTLYVHSASTESHATYQSIFAAVASACPSIKDIHLQSRLVADIECIADPLLSTIPFHLLDLTSLKLISPPPLKLDVGCMKALLAALPSLHTLKLLETTGPPTLPLSALSELAPLCPAMRFLTLYLDTKHVSASAPPNTMFSCLEVLDVQSSPLESAARDVATFLGSVLPLACVVKHSHYTDGPERMKWGPVVDFLPLIFELRAAKQTFNPIAPSEE
ncbi:hypothetical protein BDN71DRAFT_1510587 [Pleurotus eryngii]|uniref:F-box domain-containing protein n=1 Tax=Pleurotus eryngii TaxID=5323 RepID=A0A9P5ZSW7_PLEER|nr:hypothetical protein BDN71DRAFT_1510587 [Pleurotus eryngii]